MKDTDWRPSACPVCGRLRTATENPVCRNPRCSAYVDNKKISKMITAKEARKLTGPTFDERVEEQLEFAYVEIRKAAKNKKSEVALHSEFWTRGGYDCTDEYKAAVKKLEELGYNVEFFYEERLIVDMYTIVKW